MTPDQPPPSTRSDRTAPGEGPPIRPGTLTDLFRAACSRIEPRPGLNTGSQVGAAVGDAFDHLRAAWDEAEWDEYTRHQLTHILDALHVAVNDAIRTGTASAPVPATVREGRRADTGRRRLLPGRAADRAAGAKPLPVSAPLPASAAIGQVLEAVATALGHVEQAFDRRPVRAAPAAPPWYEHRVLPDVVRSLVTVDRERPDRIRDDIERLRGVLRADGVELVDYEPDVPPEQQADAFRLEMRTRDAACRFVTRVPALVRRGADREQVLLKGWAVRLPLDPVPAAENERTAAPGRAGEPVREEGDTP
ncbi:hypothetical protein [Kitasatospora sp. NPDC056184]|uniref:hypothetical protein n=1 Tax=Kitasatospora sp. NPDC056184 TaxID=3345738 RepID=UPI0035DC728C